MYIFLDKPVKYQFCTCSVVYVWVQPIIYIHCRFNSSCSRLTCFSDASTNIVVVDLKQLIKIRLFDEHDHCLLIKITPLIVRSSSVIKFTISYCRHRVAHTDIVTIVTSVLFIILLLHLRVNARLLQQFMYQ